MVSLVCIIVCCAATLVNYILVAIFLRCIVSSVRCYVYAVLLCIGIFGGASLVRLLLCNASLVHCFLVLGAIYFWCCIFGAMHCQLYPAGLLPQWRIYFINIFIKVEESICCRQATGQSLS